MKRRTGHVDLFIFVSVLALMLFSIGAVYSASNYKWADSKAKDPDFLFRRHAVRVVLGVGALFAGMFIDYHRYKKLSKYLLLLGIGFLALVLMKGNLAHGAQRWISFGPVNFQPTEFAKFALMIHLAVLIAQKQSYIQDFRYGFVPLMLWVLIVCGLIFLQPNMSNGVIILALSMMMMFVGRVNWRHIAVSVAAAVPLLIGYILVAPYRLARIQAFFMHDSMEGGETAHYQVEQAMIALGNGGLFGVGIGLSRQKELFLPESYGDFIFAIIGEEYGFIGTVTVLLIFLLIFVRGIKIAKRSIDDLGRFLALGITATIVTYALVNAAVTCGLAPTTGLPMPLLSYGGSAILFTAYSLGVLLNISMFTRIRPREQVQAPPEPAPHVGRLMK